MSDLVKKVPASEELEEWEPTPKEAKQYGISYLKQYIIKFHITKYDQLFCCWDTGLTEDDIEDMYKQCIEQGKTWQELTGWKNPDYDPKVQY